MLSKITTVFDKGDFAITDEKLYEMGSKVIENVPPMHIQRGTIIIVDGYILEVQALVYDIDKDVIAIHLSIEAGEKDKSIIAPDKKIHRIS